MYAACWFLALLPVSPAPQVEEYVIIFGADSIPYKATKAHAFAAMVQVERSPGCPLRVAGVASISWLPKTMKVRGLAIRSEVGRNVPLHETLDVFLGSGGRVCMWGPYRVEPWLAETFRARVAKVEGSYKYKGACVLSRWTVCDCARSVEEMVGPSSGWRRYIGVCGYGAAAASVIVQNFSPWMIEPEQSHPWVATLIGLDDYPLTCRSFGDYTSRFDQFRAMFQRQ